VPTAIIELFTALQRSSMEWVKGHVTSSGGVLAARHYA